MTILSFLPFYPLISFLILITFSKRLSWAVAATLSVGAVLLSALSGAHLMHHYMHAPDTVVQVQLFQWFMLGDSAVNFTLRFDSLSAVMTLVVSGIGFLIHAFAAAYMKDDENFSRFMAYMNLFIVAMLLLVLADNLVLLYLGWEGVGLCSFLLIGFWYQKPENSAAAKKAFIVTRIGDTFFAIALFLIFRETNTLTISELLSAETLALIKHNDMQFWICLLLIGGAVGKSAQLPLHTWLPDAMAGPTPVSALIHAATMVTAGVYLIARMNGIFLLSETAMYLVSLIGLTTLLLAAFTALAQNDIKRILAYSTMSQIGYMMLALGAGAFSEGIMHLMTHAFFKALLFLSAGAIILALHHQQNIFKMGGMFKKLPLISFLFFIGIAALLALPGTSGFVSKEAIIAQLYSSPTAGPVFWWGAILGALLTSIYSIRMVCLTFFGSYRGDHDVEVNNSPIMITPLIILAILSLVGGLFALPLQTIFEAPLSHLNTDPSWLHTVAIATPFIGMAIAFWLFFPRGNTDQTVIEPSSGVITRFVRSGFGFDDLFHFALVRPFVAIAKFNKADVIDSIVKLISWNTITWHEVLKATQNAQLRWYLAMLGLGLALLLIVLIMGAS